jgi:fucose permease
MTHTSSANRSLLWTTYFIYFTCGMFLSFDRFYTPDFQAYFKLSYQQLGYIQTGFGLPALWASYIAGLVASRFGYKRTLNSAMFLWAAGVMLMAMAISTGVYWFLILAMFVMGVGFNFQLVAGNPLMAELGEPKKASSRVNFGNAAGAVAQIGAPVIMILAFPDREAVNTMRGVLARILGAAKARSMLSWLNPVEKVDILVKVHFMQRLFITFSVTLLLCSFCS